MILKVFCLESIKNAGEEILGDNTTFLINQCQDQITIDRVQFMPSWKTLPPTDKVLSLLAKPLLIIGSIAHNSFCYQIKNIGYRIKYGHYFRHQLRHADKILFAVGMFKFSTQDFSYIYSLIIDIAERKSLPIMISAASVESPKPNDWRFKQLVQHLQYNSIISFTTRDGIEGVNILKNDYKLQSNVDFVGDPALWIPQSYNIKRQQKKEQIKSIGINVIRPNIFIDYGGVTSEDDIFLFYKSLIEKIEKKGYHWLLFCNGMDCDYNFGKLLINKLQLNEEKLLPPLYKGIELAKTITSFDIIFAARFHTVLTSFSLGVPFVGFFWDNKLKAFAELFNLNHCFLTEEQISNEDAASNLLVQAFEQQIDKTNEINLLKNKTLFSIKQYLK